MSKLKDIITTTLDNLKIKWIVTGEDWILSQCPSPEHIDKTPSMFLNVAEGYGKCQSCGFTVTPKFFGVGSDEEITNVFRNNTFNNVLKMLDEKFLIEEVNQFNLPPFHSEPTEDYRGIPKELLLKAEVYNCTIGRFKDRLIFPFYDLDNNLVGYTGRINGDNPNFNNAKYIHSTGIKTNHSVLYGKLIKELKLDTSKGLVLTEGNLDALTLISKGIPATPLLGFKKPTDNFIVEVIRLGFDEIIIAFDNDEAGLNKMFHRNKEEKDLSITKYWRKEYNTTLGFYCDYPLVKLLYKSKYKDFHEMIYEHKTIN